MDIISRTIISLLPFLLYSFFNLYLFIRDTNNLYSIIVFVLTLVGIGLGVLYSFMFLRMNPFIQLGLMTLIVYVLFVAMLYAKALDESSKTINHGKIFLNALYSALLFAGMFALYIFLLRELLNQPFNSIMIPTQTEQPIPPSLINNMLQLSVPVAGNLIMMLYISSSSSFFGNYNG